MLEQTAKPVWVDAQADQDTSDEAQPPFLEQCWREPEPVSPERDSSKR